VRGQSAELRQRHYCLQHAMSITTTRRRAHWGGAALCVVLVAGGCDRLGFDPFGSSDAVADGGMGASGLDAPPDAALEPVVATLSENGVAMFSGVTTDATLNFQFPGDNSGETSSFGPYWNSNDDYGVGLLRFDLAAIDPGASIVSAELDIWSNFSPSQGGTADIFAVLEQWSEAAVTFDSRDTGIPWASAGVGVPSRSAAAIASITTRTFAEANFDSELYTVTLPSSLVQDWVTDPATNFGITLQPNGAGDVGLLSSEAVLFENAPVLRLTYVVP